MKVIYAAAGLMVLLAFWAFWLALQLIPTDLGNSYMVAASVLFSAAFLMVAVARAARLIVDNIRALPAASPPMAQARMVEAPVVEAPMVEAPMVAPMVAPAPMAPLTERPPSTERPLAPLIAGATAGVATGAAIHAATRLPDPAPEPQQSDPVERDLFAVDPMPPARQAEIPDLAAEAPPPTLSMSDDPLISPAMLGETEDSALLQPGRPAPADTGEDDDLVLPPLPPIPRFGPAPADEPEAGEGFAQTEPAAATAMAEPAPMPASPTPGLIHDEDLARLSEAEADLAPLDTLEIVGAYDSGGTRFTMYSDGSVTAKGEAVDRRFRSLDDLRAFIDSGMRG